MNYFETAKAFDSSDPLKEHIASIAEATEKLRFDVLSYLFMKGKGEFMDIADILGVSPKQIEDMARELKRDGLVNMTRTWMDITPKGKKAAMMKESREVSPQKYFGEDSDFIFIPATDRRMAVKYLDREQVDYRIWPTQRGYALEVAVSDLGIITDDLRKAGVRIAKPDKIVAPPIDGTKAASALGESRVSQDMMQKVDSLLYAIMTNDKGRTRRLSRVAGEFDKGRRNDVMSNLVKNFKDVQPNEVGRVIKTAVELNFISDDGEYLQITPRGHEYILYMES